MDSRIGDLRYKEVINVTDRADPHTYCTWKTEVFWVAWKRRRAGLSMVCHTPIWRRYHFGRRRRFQIFASSKEVGEEKACE